MQKDSLLRISAIFFSFVVIGQSIAIVETIKHPKETRQPDVFVGEIELDSESEQTASLWIEPKVTLDGRHELTLWAENSQPIEAIHARLQYKPADLNLIDQNSQVGGVQLSVNKYADFLVNQTATASGTIELLAKWQQPQLGKIIVATISAQKITDQLTDIIIDYVPGTREGSYVSSSIEGDNVLQNPGIVTF